MSLSSKQTTATSLGEAFIDGVTPTPRGDPKSAKPPMPFLDEGGGINLVAVEYLSRGALEGAMAQVLSDVQEGRASLWTDVRDGALSGLESHAQKLEVGAGNEEEGRDKSEDHADMIVAVRDSGIPNADRIADFLSHLRDTADAGSMEAVLLAVDEGRIPTVAEVVEGALVHLSKCARLASGGAPDRVQLGGASQGLTQSVRGSEGGPESRQEVTVPTTSMSAGGNKEAAKMSNDGARQSAPPPPAILPPRRGEKIAIPPDRLPYPPPEAPSHVPSVSQASKLTTTNVPPPVGSTAPASAPPPADDGRFILRYRIAGEPTVVRGTRGVLPRQASSRTGFSEQVGALDIVKMLLRDSAPLETFPVIRVRVGGSEDAPFWLLPVNDAAVPITQRPRLLYVLLDTGVCEWVTLLVKQHSLPARPVSSSAPSDVSDSSTISIPTLRYVDVTGPREWRSVELPDSVVVAGRLKAVDLIKTLVFDFAPMRGCMCVRYRIQPHRVTTVDGGDLRGRDAPFVLLKEDTEFPVYPGLKVDVLLDTGDARPTWFDRVLTDVVNARHKEGAAAESRV